MSSLVLTVGHLVQSTIIYNERLITFGHCIKLMIFLNKLITNRLFYACSHPHFYAFSQLGV